MFERPAIDDTQDACKHYAMETEASCPYCGEPISLWLSEDGGSSQSYVEDCSVCCHPMQIHVHIDSEGDASLQVGRLDD